MTGNHAPLRDGDPRRLGRYTVIGRLGEGGMGTVYLATAPDGVPVAVKVVRIDLAHDEQFRRRFRSEVNRARQVPPFCTAEVLDAAPDDERPYLVVEYVDGPSLAAVVRDRGPLSQANLHGLAIGVATALTAIHGAGVVHRDLKPNNVLLAAGSPKVIDFGIAHSPQATTGHTRTDQVVGTVAYMAPERFGPESSGSTTPAADIFSWGAVIAYAGTGRNPFGSDAAPVVAARILTQPPDLTGLSGPLRDLVEQALAKDPAERPTARELIDRLLTAAPAQSALARQPELLAAVEEAQATDVATALDGAGSPGTVAAPGAAPAHPAPPSPAAPSPGAGVGAGAGLSTDATTRFDDGAVPHVPAAAAPVAAAAAPLPVSPAPAGDGPTSGPPPAPPGPSSGRWGRVTLVVVAVVALVTSLTVAGLMYGVIPLPDRSPQAQSSSSAAPTSPAASPSGAADQVLFFDRLTSENRWQPREDKDNDTTCAFQNALVVTRQSVGSYRCPGARDQLTDFTMTVDVRLQTAASCAGIWFRFDTGGYVLRVCADGYYVLTHGVGGPSAVTTVGTYPFAALLGVNDLVKVGIVAKGPDMTFTRDGQPLGTYKDPTFDVGRVVLGIFPDPKTTADPPFSVAFTNIEVRVPTP
ncbi:serine/threonine-protein kinase [Dactylosporangium sucinum]|uniref:Protein kinase domain-containing protein n=1 Tax=Dactylosporangium sucinum TaxID=1424081 RepID=A0A917U549_9ACTN|nr:serine/threonine-protein kinase [Dactylosporangium sucinum]GGM59301.1 hypothetical protein GCM10007977_070980 [Dactylosporangium sucinum]